MAQKLTAKRKVVLRKMEKQFEREDKAIRRQILSLRKKKSGLFVKFRDRAMKKKLI